MAPKTLEPGSKFEHFDRDGDGIVTDEEIAMEEKMLRIENEDAKDTSKASSLNADLKNRL